MKPKLPQLNLRDLFWLVLVCALGLGWWVDRERMVVAWDQSQFDIVVMKNALEGMGYTVERNQSGGLGIEPANP